jgi:hypothetical protein
MTRLASVVGCTGPGGTRQLPGAPMSGAAFRHRHSATGLTTLGEHRHDTASDIDQACSVACSRVPADCLQALRTFMLRPPAPLSASQADSGKRVLLTFLWAA